MEKYKPRFWHLLLSLPVAFLWFANLYAHHNRYSRSEQNIVATKMDGILSYTLVEFEVPTETLRVERHGPFATTLYEDRGSDGLVERIFTLRTALFGETFEQLLLRENDLENYPEAFARADAALREQRERFRDYLRLPGAR